MARTTKAKVTIEARTDENGTTLGPVAHPEPVIHYTSEFVAYLLRRRDDRAAMPASITARSPRPSPAAGSPTR